MSDKRQKNQLVLAFLAEIRVKPEGLPGKGPNRSRRSAKQKARPLVNR
jgi:hypothetical protein